MYCKEIASINNKHFQVYSLILSSYLTTTLINNFYSLIACSFLRFMRTLYRLTTNLKKLISS